MTLKTFYPPEYLCGFMTRNGRIIFTPPGQHHTHHALNMGFQSKNDALRAGLIAFQCRDCDERINGALEVIAYDRTRDEHRARRLARTISQHPVCFDRISHVDIWFSRRGSAIQWANWDQDDDE